MTDGRRRLQVRVTLDSDMGALFHWASEIPERARARELVGMLRVGYAICTRNASRATSMGSSLGESEANAAANRRADKDKSPLSGASLELQAAEATLQVFDPASVTGVPPP